MWSPNMFMLEQAMKDAKSVRETALENARLAMSNAFSNALNNAFENDIYY